MGPLATPSIGRSGPAALLDGPPPHPQMQSPMGGPGAGGVAPGRTLPPEVLLGLISSGNTIAEMLDTVSQMAPDIAAEFAMAKDLVQRGLAKLMTAGGGIAPPSPMTGPIPGETVMPRRGL